MPSEVTVFKLKFTDRLNLSPFALANIANTAAEVAKRGEVLRFCFAEQNSQNLADPANCASSSDPAYVALAQARAWQADGGFYFENGEVFLKVKCRRAFDLASAYAFYHSRGLSTRAFPQDRIDETSKAYPSVKSLTPLIFTPSYQYGRIREDAEDDFYRALLANDWVAKDILIHCLPGVEIECPFYVLFNRFVVKIGAAGDDDQTSDLFYDVVVDYVTPSHGRIQVPNTINRYYFLQRSDLLHAGRFPRFQDIRHQLVNKQPDAMCLFVSHDWQGPSEPDPRNQQYDELVQLLSRRSITFRSQQLQYFIGTRTFVSYGELQTEKVLPETFEYIWYDYSCLPQKPRDRDDERVFREQLSNLNNIFASKIRTVQIGNKERQKRRTWCVMEQEIAKKNNGINIDFVGEPANFGLGVDGSDQIFARARISLEGTYTTELDDARIVQWMLYKSIADALIHPQPRSW